MGLRGFGLVALLALGPSLDAAAKPAILPMRIDYTVERVAVDSYEITLRFDTDRNGVATLRIPSEWADAHQAERGIEGLEVLTPGAALEDTPDPHVKRVAIRSHAMRRAALTVRYRLRQIADGELDVRSPTTYLPVIQPSYFEWIGWTTWVVPTIDDHRRVRVRMRFIGLPDDWQFASSFGADRNDVEHLGSMQQFRQSIVVGGDFRLRSRPLRSGRLLIAVRGTWPFRDSELADRLATIVEAQRTFWADERQGDFLVTLMPVASPQGQRSMGGTGLTRSFATWTTPIASIDELDRQFTHEYFHTWNARALGTFPAPEALGSWFSEGFTDYYTHLLRLRWGMLSLGEYADAYDRVLRALAGLGEDEIPNAEIVARLYSEWNRIGKLPYWRGMLLAAKWDHEIRIASGGRRSLDDAMRRLFAEHRRGVERLDAARIARAMDLEGVTNATADIARHIDRGQRLVLANGALTDCVRSDDIEDRPFDAGFNYEESLRLRRIVGVDLAGPAHAAGLRNNQILRGLSVTPQSDTAVSVGVQDTRDSPVQVVTYLPVGRPVPRQHVAVRPDLRDQDRADCLARLGVKAH